MRFTKLHTTFWSGRDSRKIAAAGPQGFQVYLYLLSSSMSNYIGLYFLNKHQAMSELRISEADLDTYIAKFVEDGFMKYDADTEVLWVINAAADNIGEVTASDKKVVALRKDFAAVDKKCPLREEFYNKYSKMLKLEHETFGAPAQKPAELAPVVAAPATPEQAAVDALAGLVIQMRTLKRAEFPESGDAFVKLTARQIHQFVGMTRLQQMVLNATHNGDLDLEGAVSMAERESIAAAAAKRAQEECDI